MALSFLKRKGREFLNYSSFLKNDISLAILKGNGYKTQVFSIPSEELLIKLLSSPLLLTALVDKKTAVYYAVCQCPYITRKQDT